MAAAIAPTYGEAARYLVGIGLFAAGLTSSITAPLATAYALSEIARKPRGGPLFKTVALAILVIGTLVALVGYKPISIILVAQVANGILLPVVAIFLLVAMNRRSLLGDKVNGSPTCSAAVLSSLHWVLACASSSAPSVSGHDPGDLPQRRYR